MVLYVQIERLLFQRLQAPSYTNIYKTSFKNLTYFCAAISATIICYICRRDKTRRSFSIVNPNESTEVYRASKTIFSFRRMRHFLFGKHPHIISQLLSYIRTNRCTNHMIQTNWCSLYQVSNNKSCYLHSEIVLQDGIHKMNHHYYLHYIVKEMWSLRVLAPAKIPLFACSIRVTQKAFSVKQFEWQYVCT